MLEKYEHHGTTILLIYAQSELDRTRRWPPDEYLALSALQSDNEAD